MQRCLTLLLLACLFALCLPAFQGFAKVATVEPESGKQGDIASAKGENLGKTAICEIYLTDGKNDFKAVITEQSSEEIKFKVPKAQAGRYHIMLLTAKEDSMLEQPLSSPSKSSSAALGVPPEPAIIREEYRDGGVPMLKSLVLGHGCRCASRLRRDEDRAADRAAIRAHIDRIFSGIHS